MVKTNPRRRRNKEPTSGGGFRNILAVLATTTPACDNSYADGASGEPNHRGLKRKAAGAATGSCAAADGLSLSSPSVHGAPATAVESWTVQGSKRSKIQRAAWTLLRSEEPRELRDSVTAGEQPIPRTAQVVETERREERYMGWRQSLQGIDDSGQQPGERHSSYIRGGCAPPALQAAVNKIHSLISSDSNATPCLITASGGTSFDVLGNTRNAECSLGIRLIPSTDPTEADITATIERINAQLAAGPVANVNKSSAPSGFTGVYKTQSKWAGTVTVENGRSVGVGSFDTAEGAACAVDRASNLPPGALLLVPRKSSGFKYVCWERQTEKWRGSFLHKGRRVLVGSFDTEEGAARAVDRALIALKGDGAEVNFKGDYGDDIIVRYDSVDQFLEAKAKAKAASKYASFPLGLTSPTAPISSRWQQPIHAI